MSKNLTRKGLALVSGLSLAVTGLVAAPANAAPGDTVFVYENSGTGFNVFVQDTYKIDAEIDGTVLSPQLYDDIRWKLETNAGAIKITPTAVDVNFNGDYDGSGGDRCEAVLTYTAYDANDQVAQASSQVVVGSDTTLTGNNAAPTTDAECLSDSDVALTISSAATITWGATWSYIVLTDQKYVVSSGDLAAIDVAIDSAASVQSLSIAMGTSDDGWGDGNSNVKVTAWAETSAVTIVDSNVSTTETINFYDPKLVSVIPTVERVSAADMFNAATAVTSLNADGQTSLSGTIRWSVPINYDQITWSEWEYSLDSTESGQDLTSSAIDVRASSGEAFLTNNTMEILTPAGYSTTNKSRFGKVLYRAKVGAGNLGKGESYRVGISHTEDTDNTIEYLSAGFQVTNFTSFAGAIEAGLSSDVNASLSTEAVTARAGTKAISYVVQAKSGDVTSDGTGPDINGDGVNNASDDFAAYSAANVPVLAIVKAGAFIPTGETIAVSGTNDTISRANGTVITTGLTDSKGKFTVTVTTGSGRAGQSYTVDLYTLKTDGTWSNLRTAADSSSLYTTTYANPAATTFAASNSVLSGDDVTVSFTLKDQFGQPMSASATGLAYSVELKAPVKTNLELFAPVTNGVASFTFKNYLTTQGLSDVLTARVYTGTSTSPTYVASMTQSVTLYKTTDSKAINVVDKITGVVVTYDDFITGVASVTNVAPNDNSFTFTGSVVDSNGTGVPGAPVTVSGEGFQFFDGTSYYVDTISLAASQAGTFSLTVYTKKASATGNALNVKSGTLTAKTLVVSKVPDGDGALSAANLSFKWDVPATLVMNTTYAITATVADKWGNPIRGAEIDFEGYAAAQFNGAAKATRTTGANGTAVAFLRSLKDVDGISAIGATLKKVNQNGDANEDVDNLGSTLTDDTATKWDESKWSNVIETNVNFLKSGSGAAGTGKVNVGSFNGKLVVYASGLNGARISWKVGGKWGKGVASSNYAIFNRPTPVAGATVSVDIYVNGVKTLTKSVVTR